MLRPIDKLKELECRHGSGWRFQDNTDDQSVSDECMFLNAFELNAKAEEVLK